MSHIRESAFSWTFLMCALTNVYRMNLKEYNLVNLWRHNHNDHIRWSDALTFDRKCHRKTFCLPRICVAYVCVLSAYIRAQTTWDTNRTKMFFRRPTHEPNANDHVIHCCPKTTSDTLDIEMLVDCRATCSVATHCTTWRISCHNTSSSPFVCALRGDAF